MTKSAAPVDEEEVELQSLCNAANSGSAWAVLLVCFRTSPESLPLLLRIVGVPSTGKLRERAFDAAADGWAMYQDALDHEELG